MPENSSTPDEDTQAQGTTTIGRLLDRINAGDENARWELISECYERFQVMARQLLDGKKFRNLRDQGVVTDEVVNEVIVERILDKDKFGRDLLDRTEFKDSNRFFNTVVNRMRLCLLDVYRGRGGMAKRRSRQDTNRPTTGGRQPVDKAEALSRSEADELEYRKFLLLEAIDELDDETDRTILNYRHLLSDSEENPKGMSREDIATRVGLSPRQVTRRYKDATEKLEKLITERL